MRLAVLSDIHSNLEAFEAVLSLIDRLGVDELLCLGDVVGYNADPNACVHMLRSLAARTVMGNHDARVAGLDDTSRFNPPAAEAVAWTRSVITEENASFLRGLPAEIAEDGDFVAVHGSPGDYDAYILGPSMAAESMELVEDGGFRLCFFGHTHRPVAYVERGSGVETATGRRVALGGGRTCMANPGSVGQPRDGDPRASFLVYDRGEAVIEFFRVRYDVERAAAKVLAAGLPEAFASRLKGGW